jgi:hypothetical protein
MAQERGSTYACSCNLVKSHFQKIDDKITVSGQLLYGKGIIKNNK